MTSRKYENEPQKRLACAVIHQALRDADSHLAPAPVREGARLFLSDSDRLGFWCAVAGIRMTSLRERVPALDVATGGRAEDRS